MFKSTRLNLVLLILTSPPPSFVLGEKRDMIPLNDLGPGEYIITSHQVK